MSQDELFINGELLRLRREARGWVLADMATRACMSVKQIRQLEEGGVSAFYSTAVKATAAKKVAVLLGLSAEEVFAATSEAPSVSPEPAAMLEASVSESVPQQNSLRDSPETTADDTAEPKSVHANDTTIQQAAETSKHEDQPKSKTSFLTIAILFVVALAAAAYLQPKEEVVVEPPPPVDVLSTDAADPASAASAAEGAASAVPDASSVLMPASVSKPGAAVPTVTIPGASVASAPAPTSSAASKAH